MKKYELLGLVDEIRGDVMFVDHGNVPCTRCNLSIRVDCLRNAINSLPDDLGEEKPPSTGLTYTVVEFVNARLDAEIKKLNARLDEFEQRLPKTEKANTLDWANTPEGKAAIQEALEKGKRMADREAKSGRVDPAILNIPFSATDSPPPEVPFDERKFPQVGDFVECTDSTEWRYSFGKFQGVKKVTGIERNINFFAVDGDDVDVSRCWDARYRRVEQRTQPALDPRLEMTQYIPYAAIVGNPSFNRQEGWGPGYRIKRDAYTFEQLAWHTTPEAALNASTEKS